MTKIIVLIIADDTKEYYVQMQNIWNKYINTHPNIKCFFIKFNPNIEQDVLEEKSTIWIKGVESYIPGILEKTMISLKYLVENNVDFDYIFRTNLSSVINFNFLYNFITTNLIEYGGPQHAITYRQIARPKLDIYLKKIDPSNRYFPGGTGIVMNLHCVKKLIEENANNNIDYNIIDDVSIGLTLSKYFKFTPIKRYDMIKTIKKIQYIQKVEINPDIFLYRCKDEQNHIKTINIMNLVCHSIYGI